MEKTCIDDIKLEDAIRHFKSMNYDRYHWTIDEDIFEVLKSPKNYVLQNILVEWYKASNTCSVGMLYKSVTTGERSRMFILCNNENSVFELEELREIYPQLFEKNGSMVAYNDLFPKPEDITIEW